MKSKIYSGEYVKTTTKGLLWIPVFLAIGFLMAFPVTGLLMLGNWSGAGYDTAQTELLYTNLWKDGFMRTGLVITVAAALLNAISAYWYLYSARKVDFYHSLPVKRSHMFWHRTFTGLLYYLIPYVLTVFLAVCTGAMRGFFGIQYLKLAVCMLLLHLMIYFLLYFSIVLVISMTGNLLMGILSLLGIFLYGPVLLAMLSVYQVQFFSTTYVTSSYRMTMYEDSWSSPLMAGIRLVYAYAEDLSPLRIIIFLLLTVATGAAAYFAFVRRPSEKTGRALVYGWSEPILKFMMVVPTGLGVGLIFHLIPGPSIRTPWWIFGLVVGTLFAHGLMEIICGLDFRKFSGHKIQLMISMVTVAVCALVFKADLAGYDNYIPAYDKTEKICINFSVLGGYENTAYVKQEQDDIYRIRYGAGYASMFVNGEDEIYNIGKSQGIYDALKKVIDGQEKNRHDNVGSIPVGYKLKSGRVVYRRYNINSSQAKELLKECFKMEELRAVKYSFLDIDTKYLQWINGAFYDDNYYNLFQDDPLKQAAVIEALRADVQEAEAEVFMEAPAAALTFNYQNVPVGYQASYLIPGRAATEALNNTIYLYPGFKRTMALIEECGHPLSMKEVSVEYAEVVYYAEDGNGEFPTLKFDKKEELEALCKSIVPYSLEPLWTGTEDGFSVNVKIKGREELLGMQVIKDKIPDFIIEKGRLYEQQDSTAR